MNLKNIINSFERSELQAHSISNLFILNSEMKNFRILFYLLEQTTLKGEF